MKHRLHQNRDYPTVTVLRDLASQENCDGEPYDQMIEAADEIERLRAGLYAALAALYQGALIMTHRDRAGDSPGRREAAGDAGQRRSQAHCRRLSHEPSRRPPALELDANTPQPLTEVSQPDAYGSSKRSPAKP